MRKISFTVFAVFTLLTLNAQDTKKFLKEGNNHLEYEHYRKAANDFKLVLKDEPENVEALYKLGKAYLGSYRHPEALEMMEKALALSKDIDKHQDYWFGRAYHLNYQFDEAIKYYQKYLESISKNDPRAKDLEKFILECGYAKEFINKQSHYRIDNVGAPINTTTDEHSPIITQDGNTMMFTSRKYTETGESENDNFSEQILVSAKDDNGKWTKPVSFEHNLDGHDATVQLYDNDTKLILYRNTGAGDLYVSEKKGSKWSDPIPIPYVNSPWPEIDAYVSNDGKTMIYSSNFKSVNHDNSDLFIMRKDVLGKWTEPKSIGENINTIYDEISPFISTDGKTLFFSSKGHNSMGGFDVFKSYYDSETDSWSKPVNLGYPLNTPGDDIYFYYSNKDNWSGYFSSYRRDGYGEKDIYQVVFVPNVHIIGKVIDVNSGNPIGNVVVEFLAEGDAEEVASSDSEIGTGKYLVNVLADRSYSVLVKNDQGQTLGTFEYEVPLLKDSDPLEYVFDIEIDAVFPELITESVNKAVPDDEQIVSIDDEESTQDQYVDEDEESQITNDFTSNGASNTLTNNSNGNVKKTEVSEAAVKQAKEHFKMDDIETGCKRVLHHVYFDFNKTTLQESSFNELDKLACLMSSNENVTVEIGGYTDNVGNDAYNKNLSQKRAESVVNYLVKQGIPKARLTAVGYGKEHPIASNDDEEEGRELNRRTEFKILKK